MKAQQKDGTGELESTNSVISSVHSLAESVHTLSSNTSSTVAGTTKDCSKRSEEEEKVVETIPESKSGSVKAGRRHFVQKNEEQPAIR